MLYTDFLTTVSGCPFCEGRNKVILQSDHCFLTYALAPYHKHHLLVIPNMHRESFTDLTAEEMDDIDALEKKAIRILRNLGYTNISLLMREGDAKNKSVKHVHFHVIPQVYIGELYDDGSDRKILSESEIDKAMKEIRAVLAD